MKRLLTVAETAKILSCSKRTVYRLLADGLLEGGKIRNATRIIDESVDRYIERMVLDFQLENGPYQFADEKKCASRD